MYLSKGASKVPSSPDTRLPQTSRHIHALPLQHTHRALVLRHLQADKERVLRLLTNLQSMLRESNPYVQDFVHAAEILSAEEVTDVTTDAQSVMCPVCSVCTSCGARRDAHVQGAQQAPQQSKCGQCMRNAEMEHSHV